MIERGGSRSGEIEGMELCYLLKKGKVLGPNLENSRQPQEKLEI